MQCDLHSEVNQFRLGLAIGRSQHVDLGPQVSAPLLLRLLPPPQLRLLLPLQLQQLLLLQLVLTHKVVMELNNAPP